MCVNHVLSRVCDVEVNMALLNHVCEHVLSRVCDVEVNTVLPVCPHTAKEIRV